KPMTFTENGDRRSLTPRSVNDIAKEPTSGPSMNTPKITTNGAANSQATRAVRRRWAAKFRRPARFAARRSAHPPGPPAPLPLGAPLFLAPPASAPAVSGVATVTVLPACSERLGLRLDGRRGVLSARPVR